MFGNLAHLSKPRPRAPQFSHLPKCAGIRFMLPFWVTFSHTQHSNMKNSGVAPPGNSCPGHGTRPHVVALRNCSVVSRQAQLDLHPPQSHCAVPSHSALRNARRSFLPSRGWMTAQLDRANEQRAAAITAFDCQPASSHASRHFRSRSPRRARPSDAPHFRTDRAGSAVRALGRDAPADVRRNTASTPRQQTKCNHAVRRSRRGCH